MKLKKLKSEELWKLYSKVIKELKTRNLIRSKNITGERGESVAIDFYKKTTGLPKLQAAPVGTKNVDALSKDGERYAIKTVVLPNKTTGVFYGMGNPDDSIKKKKFEYLIIVQLNDFLEPELILEIDWNTFFENKKWHSRMRAYNINVTNNLISQSKIIYKKK